MTNIPFGLPLVSAIEQGLIGPIIVRQRNIGGFIADVTVRERHSDELMLTDNPVEQGAEVTDHAYKRPARLTVIVGYSNSSPQAEGDPNYMQDQYQNFLGLQALRQPFDVITGKRAYTNMEITLLETETDQKTENASFFTVEMRELIIVTTQTVSVPPASQLANPSSNAATTNLGTAQLQPAPNYNAAASPVQ